MKSQLMIAAAYAAFMLAARAGLVDGAAVWAGYGSACAALLIVTLRAMWRAGK